MYDWQARFIARELMYNYASQMLNTRIDLVQTSLDYSVEICKQWLPILDENDDLC